MASFVSLGIAVAQKLGHLTPVPLPLNRNVLVLFSMMLFLMAVLFIMMGVISELLVRIYHQTERTGYSMIRRITRGDADIDGHDRRVVE